MLVGKPEHPGGPGASYATMGHNCNALAGMTQGYVLERGPHTVTNRAKRLSATTPSWGTRVVKG